MSAQPRRPQRKHIPLPGEDELAWQLHARCVEVDPELFFPDRGDPSHAAKRVCIPCEVRNQCLDYAIKHRERHGIWGGLSERQRQKLEQRRRRTA